MIGKVLRWIKDESDPEPPHEAIMERTGLSNESLAAKWLLHTSDFMSLEEKLSQDQSDQVFWLKGMMGSGKTTLITTSDGALGISHENIIRGLCSKLAWNKDTGELSPCARDFYKRYHPIEGEIPLTISKWQQLLKDLVAESRTFFIIDALDECQSRDRNDFLGIIKDLRKSQHLHVIISSKGQVEAKPYFGMEIVEYPVINPEARNDMSQFIDKRISTIKADPVRSNSILFKNNDLSKRLVEALNEHAGGMFRWVEVWLGALFPLDHDPIVQSDVAKSKLEILESARTLKDLSNEANLMKQAYQQLWDANARDERRRCHQIRMFHFVLGAFAPMTPQTLLEAICFNPKDPTKYSCELETDYVQKLYHNFLSVEDEVLVFEHVSAKTFILELDSQENNYHIFADEVLNHTVIAESSLLLLREPEHPIWDKSGIRWNECLADMTSGHFDRLASSPYGWSTLFDEYDFQCLGTYIIDHWYKHISMLHGKKIAPEISHLWLDNFKHFPSTFELLCHQSQSLWMFEGLSFASHSFSVLQVDNDKVMVDPLMFALSFRMSPFHCRDRLNETIESLGDILARNLEGATALHVAVQQNDLDSVEALLEISQRRDLHRKLLYCKDQFGEYALHFAKSDCVVEALLQLEAKIVSSFPAPDGISGEGRLLHAKNRAHQTPIFNIVENCSRELVLSIIEDKYATFDDIAGEQGARLWKITTTRGFKEVARLFLKHTDIDFKHENEQTALMCAAAAQCNQIDMAEFLLSQGANINATGGEYGTALGVAASCDHLDMVNFLLGQGADINATGGIYGTALGVAAFRARSCWQVFKLLLDEGANVNTVGGEYGTALGAAISQRWMWTLDEFRRHKVDIDLAIREWPDRESWTEAGQQDSDIASAWARYKSDGSNPMGAAVASRTLNNPNRRNLGHERYWVPLDRCGSLGHDLLLEIFDILTQDHHASLTSAVRCCKVWQPIVQSALYEDVILDQQRLAKFVGRCANIRVRSLTVLLNAVPVNPYDPSQANEIAVARLAGLAQLCTCIKKMRPAALSISIDLPFPCTAANEVACIVECLPTSCTSLEIKLSHGSCISPPPAASSRSPHLCDSIRRVLPQLRHIRLCLPVLCPALFSSNSSDEQGQEEHRQAVRAPSLQTCLVNLAQREPGPSTSGAWTTPCSEDTHTIPYVGQQQELPSALAPMVEVLRDFTILNSSNLESLTVLDVQPHNPTLANSYAGWVRRDFISNCSFPIPVWSVGIFSSSAHVARVPVLPRERMEARDWISKSRSQLETMAEGGTWIQTSSGARLPVQMMLSRQKLPDAALTRAQFQQGNRTSCMLWANEDKTGQHLLPTGPGELLREWEFRGITPDG